MAITCHLTWIGRSYRTNQERRSRAAVPKSYATVGNSDLSLTALWVPEGAVLPKDTRPLMAGFPAVLIPVNWDGPAPRYPWTVFGRFVISEDPTVPLGPGSMAPDEATSTTGISSLGQQSVQTSLGTLGLSEEGVGKRPRWHPTAAVYPDITVALATWNFLAGFQATTQSAGPKLSSGADSEWPTATHSSELFIVRAGQADSTVTREVILDRVPSRNPVTPPYPLLPTQELHDRISSSENSSLWLAADQRKVPVDLLAEEASGGHTISEHVGKAAGHLQNRVRTETYEVGETTIYMYRAGSFPSLEAATKLVNSTLSMNTSVVSAV